MLGRTRHTRRGIGVHNVLRGPAPWTQSELERQFLALILLNDLRRGLSAGP